MLCAIKQPVNYKIFKHVSELILVECYIKNTYYTIQYNMYYYTVTYLYKL